MRLSVLIFALLGICSFVHSQYYTSGEDPASIRWRQIATPHFTVVFPSEMEADARRLAVVLDGIRGVNRYSANHVPAHFQVLMHGRSAYANGFVAWAPRRMELYPTGGTGQISVDWLEHLGMHEYRHVVQIDRMNRGFTRFLYYGFGQQAVGGMFGLHLPMWFLEGDATLAETLHSESGRGRMPWFEQRLRAQVIDLGIYSYDKAYFGSYRHFVPNYYEMGYHLVAGVRGQYGASVWTQVVDGVARNSWWPFQFSRQLRQQTGRSKTRLYRSVFDSLAVQWHRLDTLVQPTSAERVSPGASFYRNYLFPHPMPDGSFIAEVTGPSDEGRYVRVDAQGHSSSLLIPGVRTAEPFSVAANRMVWSEYRVHLRWGNAQNSIVRLLDLSTLETWTLSPSRGKYFTPALSPDGGQVAWVRVSDSNRCAVELFDVAGRRVTATFPLGRQMPLSMAWCDTGHELAAVVLTEQGKQLSVLNVASGQWRTLLDPVRHEIRHLHVGNGRVYFSTTVQGQEEICSVALRDSMPVIRQHTRSRFGASAPCTMGDTLVYNLYTATGQQVVRTHTGQSVTSPEVFQSIALHEPLLQQEPGVPAFNYSLDTTYISKPYSKWNLLNVHSWAPALVNTDEARVSRGVSVMSQNPLSTFTVTAGYNGDRNYQSEKYNLLLSWRGWLPVLSLDVKEGDKEIDMEGYYTSSGKVYYLSAHASQNIIQLKPGVSLPLDLSSGAWYRRLEPSARFTFYKSEGYQYVRTDGEVVNNRFVPGDTYTVSQPDYLFQGLEFDVYAHHLRRGSSRDVATRWGQMVQFNHRVNTSGSIDRGAQTALFTRLYLPGIGRHHAIRLENSFQHKSMGDTYLNGLYRQAYSYSSIVSMPRGFATSNAERLYSFKGDYQLPLCYPDVSLGGISYVKRLRANLFYDYSHARRELQEAASGEMQQLANDYHSLGYELRADMHLFRFIYPVNIGYRQAWLPQSGSWFGEVLFGVSIP